MTTPPGWYADPDHQGPAPAPERWWDGAAWTESRRGAPSVHDAQTMLSTPSALSPPPAPPGAPPYGQPPQQPPGFAPGPAAGAPYGPPMPGAAPGYPGGYPGYPGGPDAGGPPPGRGRRNAVVATVGAFVVAAIVAGVVVLGGDDGGGDDSNEAGQPKPSFTVPTPEESGPGGGTPTAPSQAGDRATDPANSISVPVLSQWTANPPNAVGLGITTSPYPCPDDTASTCVRGGVFSFGTTGKGYRATTAEGIAKEDIERNAEDSYGAGPGGKRAAYGGLNGHEELKAEPVTVAGQSGYLVRWKADTKKGDDGYVQSIAFPEPGQAAGGQQTMVIVRFGFDVSASAPPLSAMDEIVQGIEPAAGDGEGV
ncbi:DUF2510 domain-containing protein [Streptomyces zagrosensis]|uniref:DUF2510 domain-containing protein n=1 Tax=Streptomyces zagrosensis TaxID=1042984 RepID=A0A7W9QEN3_9ACTN|nr:DUF2510 domain-containing protein [Streptomyces zagrosensis]MBB5938876.1 hypothetical protein [Streptomyces zagrosensis]